jgi:hypothetical protein
MTNPARPDDGPDIEPGADFHHHLAVDLRHIGIVVVHEDLESELVTLRPLHFLTAAILKFDGVQYWNGFLLRALHKNPFLTLRK